MSGLNMLYLGLVMVLVVAFFMKRMLQKWTIHFARILFVVSILGSLIGIFTIRPFVYFAEVSLKSAGTLESIQRIDKALPLSKVITPVKDIVDQIKQLWNRDVEPTYVVVKPSQGMEVGILEAEIYPGIVSATARSYKFAVMVLSLLGLALSVYMNFSISGILELEALQKKYELLEKKVEELS